MSQPPRMSAPLWDTHVHLPHGDADAAAGLIDRARAAGVLRLTAIGGSSALNAAAIAAGVAAPEAVSVTVGCDRDCASHIAPDQAEAAQQACLDEARRAGVTPVGLGEVGLDFHYTPATARAQTALFEAALTTARRHCLPVIVHSREADAETLVALRAHVALWRGPADAVGILHCYTGDAVFARALLDLGFFISFSGIVTFRNADALRAVARTIPGDQLLVETDTPYLSPVPLRGKPNEPAHLPHIVRALAAVRGETAEALAESTWRNAARVFQRPAA